MKRSIQKPLDAFFKTITASTKRTKVEGGRIWRERSNLAVFKQDIPHTIAVYIHRGNLEVENTTLLTNTSGTKTDHPCRIEKKESFIGKQEMGL